MKNTIIPFLNKSNGHEANIVICDRYYYSTIAFQATQGLDGEMLIEINKDFLKPDIAFIMDINPETALERIKGREKEKFEKLEFMNKLREKFLELPRLLKDNIKIIDASKGINEVFEDIKKEVDKLL
ncbi:dTMP kinase [Candidatus Woesearchaeota archaeon]|nr:dTMP kinase [Candidatus Woesearchaeota archaeon]